MNNPIFGNRLVSLQRINNADLGSAPSGSILLAAGPLNKQPGTMGHRIVLVEVSEGGHTKFVVWQQNFPSYTDESVDLTGPWMHQGSYFHVSEFEAAVKEFARRLDVGAQFLRSLYR